MLSEGSGVGATVLSIFTTRETSLVNAAVMTHFTQIILKNQNLSKPLKVSVYYHIPS
jgi:hypothetical protein